MDTFFLIVRTARRFTVIRQDFIRHTRLILHVLMSSAPLHLEIKTEQKEKQELFFS